MSRILNFIFTNIIQGMWEYPVYSPWYTFSHLNTLTFWTFEFMRFQSYPDLTLSGYPGITEATSRANCDVIQHRPTWDISNESLETNFGNNYNEYVST